MRLTTNQIMSNYQTGLNSAAMQQYSDMNSVMSQRKFQTVAEDPSSAAKAFQLRKQSMSTEDHIANVTTIISKFNNASSSALQINTIANQVSGDMLRAINGATSYESRLAYAQGIDALKESIVSSANAKFGDSHIFGGQNVDFVPFQLDEDGYLQFSMDGENYYSVSDPDPDVQEILQSFSDATVFVDLGFGLEYEAGTTNLIENSAFNISICGLDMLGFGETEDGMPTNIVDLMNDFVIELEIEPPDIDYLNDIHDQFSAGADDILDFITSIGTRGTFLNTTQTRLEDSLFALQEKIVDTENIDVAEAITNYSWSTFAYNQALKIGNGILSQSFIDFMH